LLHASRGCAAQARRRVGWVLPHPPFPSPLELRSGRFQRSRCHPISRRPARDPLPAGRGGCEHRTLQKALPSKNGRRKILPLACRNWPRDLLGSGWSGVPARSPFFENSPLVLSCPRSAWSRTDRRSAARPRSRTDRCSEFSPRLRRGVAQRRTTPTGMVTDPPAEPGAAGEHRSRPLRDAKQSLQRRHDRSAGDAELAQGRGDDPRPTNLMRQAMGVEALLKTRQHHVADAGRRLPVW
jgi:hypothetical protein